MTTRALVLGGGGEAGLAWEIGLLAGFADHGMPVRDADVVIGTSAGAIVGALLLSGADLSEEYARLLVPVAPSQGKGVVEDTAMMAAFREALAGVTGEREARARLGAVALRSSSASEEEHRAGIRARIGTPAWPSTRLVLTAVDTGDGSLRTLDAGSGVSLLDAVAASSAAPLVWPPITIGDRRFMDGGMRSPTNADLAAGCDKVLVVAPISSAPDSALGPGLTTELAQLRQRAEVHVVVPHHGALPPFGAKLMDPATRPSSARAGHDQARTAIGEARTWWT